ncbi:hypothetical protein SPW_0657 [Streptomyces sp. W007]|nr:hypothetical protein SPW_0657 [Streptomyces sp. W007]
MSAYDVVGVRGRGYRPEQVDRATAALTAERDGALDELARLTGRVEELLAESARLAETVATLPVQDYAELGGAGAADPGAGRERGGGAGRRCGGGGPGAARRGRGGGPGGRGSGARGGR